MEFRGAELGLGQCADYICKTLWSGLEGPFKDDASSTFRAIFKPARSVCARAGHPYRPLWTCVLAGRKPAAAECFFTGCARAFVSHSLDTQYKLVHGIRSPVSSVPSSDHNSPLESPGHPRPETS